MVEEEYKQRLRDSTRNELADLPHILRVVAGARRAVYDHYTTASPPLAFTPHPAVPLPLSPYHITCSEISDEPNTYWRLLVGQLNKTATPSLQLIMEDDINAFLDALARAYVELRELTGPLSQRHLAELSHFLHRLPMVVCHKKRRYVCRVTASHSQACTPPHRSPGLTSHFAWLESWERATLWIERAPVSKLQAYLQLEVIGCTHTPTHSSLAGLRSRPFSFHRRLRSPAALGGGRHDRHLPGQCEKVHQLRCQPSHQRS